MVFSFEIMRSSYTFIYPSFLIRKVNQQEDVGEKIIVQKKKKTINLRVNLP